MGSSRLGGVPTAVPRPASEQLDLLSAGDGARHARDAHSQAAASSGAERLLPGVVRITGWLDASAQRTLVNGFRQWALPPAGLRHPRVPAGGLMSVQSVCLGWHWQPYRYSRTADDTDGAPVKPLPRDLADLACAAVADTFGQAEAEAFTPDAAIVNLYAPGARLGLHQDAEEPSVAPVVTISLGDTCVFRLAGTDRRTAPFSDLRVRSGDLVVFGGPNRRVYHGVPRIFPGTSPPGLGLPPGRLSITIRQTGLNG